MEPPSPSLPVIRWEREDEVAFTFKLSIGRNWLDLAHDPPRILVAPVADTTTAAPPLWCCSVANDGSSALTGKEADSPILLQFRHVPHPGFALLSCYQFQLTDGTPGRFTYYASAAHAASAAATSYAEKSQETVATGTNPSKLSQRSTQSMEAASSPPFLNTSATSTTPGFATQMEEPSDASMPEESLVPDDGSDTDETVDPRAQRDSTPTEPPTGNILPSLMVPNESQSVASSTPKLPTMTAGKLSEATERATPHPVNVQVKLLPPIAFDYGDDDDAGNATLDDHDDEVATEDDSETVVKDDDAMEALDETSRDAMPPPLDKAIGRTTIAHRVGPVSCVVASNDSPDTVSVMGSPETDQTTKHTAIVERKNDRDLGLKGVVDCYPSDASIAGKHQTGMNNHVAHGKDAFSPERSPHQNKSLVCSNVDISRSEESNGAKSKQMQSGLIATESIDEETLGKPLYAEHATTADTPTDESAGDSPISTVSAAICEPNTSSDAQQHQNQQVDEAQTGLHSTGSPSNHDEEVTESGDDEQLVKPSDANPENVAPALQGNAVADDAFPASVGDSKSASATAQESSKQSDCATETTDDLPGVKSVPVHQANDVGVGISTMEDDNDEAATKDDTKSMSFVKDDDAMPPPLDKTLGHPTVAHRVGPVSCVMASNDSPDTVSVMGSPETDQRTKHNSIVQSNAERDSSVKVTIDYPSDESTVQKSLSDVQQHQNQQVDDAHKILHATGPPSNHDEEVAQSGGGEQLVKPSDAEPANIVPAQQGNSVADDGLSASVGDSKFPSAGGESKDALAVQKLQKLDDDDIVEASQEDSTGLPTSRSSNDVAPVTETTVPNAPQATQNDSSTKIVGLPEINTEKSVPMQKTNKQSPEKCIEAPNSEELKTKRDEMNKGDGQFQIRRTRRRKEVSKDAAANSEAEAVTAIKKETDKSKCTSVAPGASTDSSTRPPRQTPSSTDLLKESSDDEYLLHYSGLSTSKRSGVTSNARAPSARTAKKSKVLSQNSAANKERESQQTDTHGQKRETPKRKVDTLEVLTTPRKTPRRRTSARTPSTALTADVRILVTGVELTARQLKIVKKLGGEIVTELSSAINATHVIAADSKSSIRRTPKLMIALCRTPNIVSLEWLNKSGSHGSWLPCDEFLILNDQKAERLYEFSMAKTMAILKGNLEDQRYILDGWSVYICDGVAGNKAPKKDELKYIVEATGATWVTTIPRGCAPEKLLILTSDPETTAQTSKKTVKTALEKGATKRSIKWFFGATFQQTTDLDDT